MSFETSQHSMYDDFLEKVLNLYIVTSIGFAFDIIFETSFSPKDYIVNHLRFFHNLT